jgi:hypothetical protein
MTAGRPIGDRIREVLTIAESMGGATAPQIRPHMEGGVEKSNAAKYCSRAVGLRLMTVDRTQRPMVYRPVEGWRDKIQERPVHVPRPAAPRPPAPVYTPTESVAMALRTQPNSVFALGARP